MKPLGLLVTFAGYTLAYFGWCSLRGEGVGLVDLLVPGRVVVIPGTPAKNASNTPLKNLPGGSKAQHPNPIDSGNIAPGFPGGPPA